MFICFVAEGEDLDDKKNSANCSTLRDLLTKTAGRVKPDADSNNKKSKAMHSTLDDIIQQVNNWTEVDLFINGWMAI